ncbi:MAG TPA: CusA/CzcA family heavy metal efflux RND transporter [Candidatus Latescibacteria bacterium]|nr:CusA/CzcA family heavy metal efflux RND transporter [Candidatus Latescibacterota bacterium]
MIERLIEYSARNRLLVIMVVAFATAWGAWGLTNVSLDAIPDLSDVQVIVFTEWPGRSPDLIEDQITYPVITTMLSAPSVKFVRGQSFFGLSFVYVIFEDGTDMYWARSRVLEYLNEVTGKLPEGVSPSLGPDATGVGWVYQYALVDTTGRNSLADLRSFQDWSLKYWLESVPGVAEVASIGGYVKQYQVNVDPNRLLAYRIPIGRLVQAIRSSNNDVGGRVIEVAGTEHMIRGRGYITSVEDIEMIPLGSNDDGTPVYLKDVARVEIGPDMRRGLSELDGKGEVVGGIVVMRYGENALRVIERVKARIYEIEPSLPEGVEIVPTYDRSDLIKRAINALSKELTQEMLIVALVIVVFLLHVKSALIPVVTLPIAVLLSFIPMYYLGLTSNIMSLGGIAIAIGAMVDAAIVLVENAHKRLESLGSSGSNGPSRGEQIEAIIQSAKEVGRPIFYSLLIVAVSFAPVFTLEAQEGRLFKPLAFTKNFAMFFAAILAVTLVPALMTLLIRRKMHTESRHPISRALFWMYGPVIRVALIWRKTILVGTVLVLTLTIPSYFGLGSEFMPPLHEGSILYMPTSLPGMSVTEAKRVLHAQGKLIKQFPEVDHVFGKVGRARTATDPAPLSMVETTITLKPENEWRFGMTWEKLIQELDHTVQIPGMPNIWWMPIQTRTEMLATGIRSPIGIKIFGPDLETIEQIAIEIEQVVKDIPGTKSAFAERVTGGYYVDFEVDRWQAARYGLTIDEVGMVIQTAIGGMNVDHTVEGRERYPINVRYARGFRDNLEDLSRVLVATSSGAQIPIGQLADIRTVTGPPMIRDESAQLVGFVFVDIVDRSLGAYVAEARQVVRDQVELPAGYRVAWGGQFEYMERAEKRLKIVIPVTLFIIFFLLYLNFKTIGDTLVVMLSVPFSLVGSVWLLSWLDYNLSVAVWVGLIALVGVATETGVVMLVYLNEAWSRRLQEGKKTASDLYEAVVEGSVRRVRPKIMTVGTTILSLVPIMLGSGVGSDVMKRIAAPMVGGLISSAVLTLVIIPVIYYVWKRREVE